MERLRFDRDFDDELEAELRAGQVPAPRPALSPAELDAIRSEAYERGRAEGLEQGRTEAETRVTGSLEAQSAASLAALLPLLEELRQTRAQHHQALEQDLLRLVQALAQRVLPEIFEAYGVRRLEAFCRRALRMAEGQGGLTLRLPVDVHPEISRNLGSVITVHGAPVELIADPDLPPGTARAEWDQGEAEQSEAALHEILRATLTHLSTPANPDRS